MIPLESMDRRLGMWLHQCLLNQAQLLRPYG